MVKTMGGQHYQTLQYVASNLASLRLPNYEVFPCYS